MVLTFHIILAWLVYAASNIFLAWWNNEVRVHRIKVGNPNQIEHPLWAAIYCGWVSPIWFIMHDHWNYFHLWSLIISLLLLHLSFFPVAYNRYSDLPAFHLSKTSKAITDITMVKIGLKSTEAVNIGALLISLTLLIISNL